MSKPSVSVCLIVSFLFVGTFLSSVAVAEPQSSAQAAAAVELKCKIQKEPGGRSHSVWILELCDAAGAPLRKVLRMAGDTVRFKNLLPGIYRIYLLGKAGRRSSESIDLSLEPGQHSRVITKEIPIPEFSAGIPGQYQVSVRALAVPKEAAQEMQRYEKCQLDGDIEGAILHLKRAVEIDPDFAEAWNNLGACYQWNGEHDEAIRIFRKVTELNPSLSFGWINLGGSYLTEKRFEEAAEANRKALNLRPNDAIVFSQLALSYYYQYDYVNAKKCFQRVIAIDPAFAGRPHLFLAQISVSEGAYEEAIGYLKAYLKIHPNAADVSDVRSRLTTVTALAAGKKPARRHHTLKTAADP